MLPERAIVESLLAQFAGSPNRLLGAYVFGSQAAERARADSDVDIAILLSQPLSAERVFDAAQQLASVLGRDVDLIDLRSATTVLRAQVIGSGRRIYEADLQRLGEFEMYALSDYARLNEERSQAVDAFLERYRGRFVVANEIDVIERCLGRAREEFRGEPSRLESPTVEDAIVLNLQRACEASIDLAMRLVAQRRLGIPQESRAAFELLQQGGFLTQDLCVRMKSMVGFRNIAVHDYQRLSRPILISILRERLGDFEEFCVAALSASSP